MKLNLKFWHWRALPAGVTLIELLVVLAIIALIATFVAPEVYKYLTKARTDTAGIQMKNVEASLDLYRIDVGRYPETLTALIQRPSGVEKWNGPYLRKAEGIVDPWGQQFGYRFPGEYGEYDLYSLGADKAEGGDGENQDITNWK